MPDKAHIGAVLEVEQIDDVRDVGLQIDSRVRQMDTFTESGQRRGIDFMASPSQ
jgi:hypothetical protein